MAEIWFYHILRGGLDTVLPVLLDKTLERGWRAVVEGPNAARLEHLDSHLWSFRDDAFLPHGRANDADAPDHPIVLTEHSGNPNSAAVRFLIDGAEATDPDAYDRVIYLFDGRDDDAVAAARRYWTSAKDAGHTVTYWQQNERGGWEKKA